MPKVMTELQKSVWLKVRHRPRDLGPADIHVLKTIDEWHARTGFKRWREAVDREEVRRKRGLEAVRVRP